MTANFTKADEQAREYRTYKLSEKQISLIRSISGGQTFLYPSSLEAAHRQFDILQSAWSVIAENLGLQIESVRAHPDSIPYILAKPARRTRENTRGGGSLGGFDDDEHRTPNR